MEKVMKLRSIIEGDVISFPTNKPKKLSAPEVRKLKQQVVDLTGGTNEGGGRMGTWIRFADERNPNEHRTLHQQAIEKMTAEFGEPRVDTRVNKIYQDLKKKHAPAGSTPIDQSTHLKHHWEVDDWVLILYPFEPTPAGSVVQMFKFRK